MAKKIIALFFLLAGCSGSQVASVQTPIVYEADIYGTLDGNQFQGIAVGSIAVSHTIRIQSPTDVNFMTIQSCHRFEHYEDVIQSGWFQPNRGFEYTYNQSPGLEDSGICVLRLGAFTKQVGAGEAYGLMLFHNDKFTLPGENICNGADGGTTGTSICQTQTGLLERLKFKAPVAVARPTKDGAAIPGQCQGKFIDDLTFEYIMPLGECVAEFMEKAEPHRKYVHLARGFNKTQYRGGGN